MKLFFGWSWFVHSLSWLCFHESINLSSSRSLLLAEPLPLGAAITHQSKREERDCFHHSNSGCLHQKLKFLYCGLFGLFSARSETAQIKLINSFDLFSFILLGSQLQSNPSISLFFPFGREEKRIDGLFAGC